MKYSKSITPFASKNTLSFAAAALLSTLFTACSMGGSTEETSSLEDPSTPPSVQASLENISIKGLAMTSAASDPTDTSLIERSLAGISKGSVVTLYELDSDSLQKTGVSFADTSTNGKGSFNIQGIVLSSPYVWITAVEKRGLSMALEYERSVIGGVLQVSAFVDVRDTTPVRVDVFSGFVAYRTRALMLAGASYEDAKAQAKQEIFEAFGVYGTTADSLDVNSLDYYAMQSVLAGIANYSYNKGEYPESQNIATSFEKTGSFLEDKRDILYGIRDIICNLRLRLSIPQGIYDQMGDEAATEYQASLLYEKYLAGMLSVILEAPPCTSEDEGVSFDVSQEDAFRTEELELGIVCRSGSWHLEFEQVPHTFGTMTDERDGNTYKTVTIDIEGHKQTWMAENLKYNGVEKGCLNGKDENCDIYGNQYDWHIATGLGESIRRNEFSSIQACIDTLSTRYTIELTPYDSSEQDSLRAALNQEMQESCEFYMSEEARFIDKEKINLDSIAITQGICPDGWRIPTFKDWETIFGHIDRRWRSIEEGAFLLTAPSIGDPFGFNLFNTVEMEWASDRLLKVKRLLGHYMMIPTEDIPISGQTGYVNTFDALETEFIFHYEDVSFSTRARDLFIRCIKN